MFWDRVSPVPRGSRNPIRGTVARTARCGREGRSRSGRSADSPVDLWIREGPVRGHLHRQSFRPRMLRHRGGKCRSTSSENEGACPSFNARIAGSSPAGGASIAAHAGSRSLSNGVRRGRGVCRPRTATRDGEPDLGLDPPPAPVLLRRDRSLAPNPGGQGGEAGVGCVSRPPAVYQEAHVRPS